MDKVWTAIVWRLPRRLVMWAAIRVLAHGTQGRYSTTVLGDLSALDAVKRWDAG